MVSIIQSNEIQLIGGYRNLSQTGAKILMVLLAVFVEPKELQQQHGFQMQYGQMSVRSTTGVTQIAVRQNISVTALFSGQGHHFNQ